jgi:cytochrome P450/NADPH-cytochrome P450 reductase
MPDSGPAPRLKSVTVAADGRAIRVGWFAGASRDAVIDAVRSAAALPASAAFHLETEAGAVVAIDDSLPDGAALRLVIDPDPAPSAPIPVPGPKPYPILGNLPELRRGGSVLASVRAMHAQYGRFFAFEAPGTRLYFCADADMISEVQATPEVFPKLVQGRTGLADLARKSVGNALFTASDDDPMWHQAHRILLPAFGAAALKNYYGRILQVADDLFAHLDRLPPGDSFPVTELMTRMTFEAIAYAAFDKRYGGIDAVALPPFVAAMNVVLLDAMQEQRRLLPGIFYRDKRRRRAAADRVMLEEVDAIIRDRRAAMAAGGAVPTDLLQIMLTTPDRVTGLKLPDENIRGQLVTFLIAGHETTSGLLSYALYHLWKNPDILDRLIAEADAVLGRDYSYRPTYEDCARLEYTQRVLKEALRLNPPAPMFTRAIVRDTTIGGGRYRLRAGERIFFSLGVLHRDPQYWGADALAFQPDRFAPEAERARHPEAYHPFGMGARACIGFQFALIEAKMVLARFVQRYRARPADPNYVLRDKQALTVKPVGLDMLLDRRPEIKGELPVHAAAPAPQAPGAQLGAAQAGDRRMSVLYGSNMGGCRDIALSLAQQAARRGFAAGVAELDAQVGQPWLTDGPVVIVTATYNGTPPDDAARFAAWLESAAPGACKGVRFAVLGCGNRQWRQTFQKFPQSVHDRMRDLGAEALLGIGAADADGDFEAAVEAWTAALWAALAEGVSDGGGVDDTAPAVTVSVVAGADAKPRDGIGWDRDSLLSVVAANRELQAPGSGGSTRHIEIPLPASVRYAAGDHLGVYPANPPALVQAVAQRAARLGRHGGLSARQGAAGRMAGRVRDGDRRGQAEHADAARSSAVGADRPCRPADAAPDDEAALLLDLVLAAAVARRVFDHRRRASFQGHGRCGA